MKKRILAAVLASASILGAVAGCSSNNATSSTGSDASSTTDSSKTEDSKTESSSTDESSKSDVELKDDDDTLTILAWESNSDIQNMVKLFCQEKGYSADKIVVTTQGKNGEEGRDKYQQYLNGDGDADIMCLEADWILKYTDDDALTAPLSALGIEE